ncbi:hypothetical protein BB987_08825 [Photorhabdus temperata]|nr:hypothetical protein BB987_08825 [Photorhabdus temperata]
MLHRRRQATIELLATVDWLLTRENCPPTLMSVKEGLHYWPAGERWANRRLKIKIHATAWILSVFLILMKYREMS